eukprot:4951904-Pleurochrysis_carterae.AAC.1
MPPSLPPSPPASEQSWTEQQPSQPQVSSARVTRSQSRAREEAGLPSLLVGSSSSTPVLNLSEIAHVDEVGRIQKQPRLASSSSRTPEPEPLSDGSDGSSLFHPRRKSSDELPEPGPDGAGSSAYHYLIPPDVPKADSDKSAASSPDPWRDATAALSHAHRSPDRIIIIRQRSCMYSSSSPDEISGPLPTTPFGTEPRVSYTFTVWPGPYVRVMTFIYASRVPSQPMPDFSSPSSLPSPMLDFSSLSSSPSPIPDSLPPSPPGRDDEASDNDFATHYLQPSEGEEEFMGLPPRSRRARDNDDVRGFAAAAQSRRGSNTPSSVDVQAPSLAAEGSTSRASDSVRSSLADVPPASRVPYPIQTSGFPQLSQSEPSPAESLVSRICSQLRDDVLSRVRVRL